MALTNGEVKDKGCEAAGRVAGGERGCRPTWVRLDVKHAGVSPSVACSYCKLYDKLTTCYSNSRKSVLYLHAVKRS